MTDHDFAGPRQVALPRVGLVLAGGGAKGAYELGVLDYLAEIGLSVNAIAGTSIGALNGAVIAGEQSLSDGVARLAEFWERFAGRSGIASHAVPGAGFDELGLPVESTAQQARLFGSRLAALRADADLLEQLVGEAVDIAGIRGGRPLWVAVYPLLGEQGLPPQAQRLLEFARFLTNGRAEILRLNELPEWQIHDAILASAALPFLFPSRVIDGCSYMDGGLGGTGDRTPVRAFAQTEHCDLLVVVHLHPDAVVNPDHSTGYTRIDIRPSVPVVPPGPLGPLTGLISFSPERVTALRALGYRDARARIEKTERILVGDQALAESQSLLLRAFTRLRATRQQQTTAQPRPVIRIVRRPGGDS